MDMSSRDSFIMNVFNAGFQKAASSFSKLINRDVQVTNPQSVLGRQYTDLGCLSAEENELYILITNVIGDVSGKSFLILSQNERQEIFKSIKSSITNHALNEAFLLEIDNIISASVIAELSNVLEIEIYGDIPHLFKVRSEDLSRFLTNHLSSEDSSLVISKAVFQFDQVEKIHPQFIWKLSSKVFDLIPSNGITSK
jgi:chemotaxis protein CheY-P-specific phosphatase CheC